MATEEKKKQIQYELYIPAQFDEVCRESLEILMEHKVHGVGDVSPGKTVYKENGEVDHCLLYFSFEDVPALLEEVLISLEELGIPYGAQLRRDGEVVADVGNLHHVYVTLDGALGVAQQFRRLDKTIMKALGENVVVSANFIEHEAERVRFTYYVADKDLALEVIEKHLHKHKLGKGASIQVIDSTLTIHERHISYVSRVSP